MGIIAIFGFFICAIYTIGLFIYFVSDRPDNKRNYIAVYITVVMFAVVYPMMYEMESPLETKTTVTNEAVSSSKMFKVDDDELKINFDFSDSNKRLITVYTIENRLKPFTVIEKNKTEYTITDKTTTIDSLNKPHGSIDTTYSSEELKAIWKAKWANKPHEALPSTKAVGIYLIILLLLLSTNIYRFIIFKLRDVKYYYRDRGMYDKVDQYDYFEVTHSEIERFCSFNFIKDLSIAKTELEYKLKKMKL